jgi:hypothetical protein
MELIGEGPLVDVVEGDLLRRLLALLTEDDLVDPFLLLPRPSLHCRQVLKIDFGLN